MLGRPPGSRRLAERSLAGPSRLGPLAFPGGQPPRGLLGAQPRVVPPAAVQPDGRGAVRGDVPAASAG
eukprot:7578051-Alexandrium_andersonii.AAC.1